MAALGVLLALALALYTARVTNISPNQLWNLCVTSVLAALVGSRLILIALNWRDLLRHPLWLLSLAMIHHPLVAAAAALIGLMSACAYARLQRMPPADTADALVAPLALGLACEQFGALLAGSGYGTQTTVPWAVTYMHPLAARWSGVPLGIPLQPVQAYAALGFLTLTVLLLIVLPVRRQQGDVAGIGLIGYGVTVFLCEIWRDWEGRGAILHGILDGPQLAAVLMVNAGALLLRAQRGADVSRRTRIETAHG